MDKKQAIEHFQKKFLGEIDPGLTNELTPACTLIRKEKKDILFYEGDEGEQVFFLLEGSIRLFRTTDQGKETVVHFVHAGELFAEILLARETRYPVSSMALEPCLLLGLSARRLRQVIQGNPDFALRYIGALTKRLKYLVNMVEHLSSRDVQERFLLYLNHLTGSHKLKTIMLPVPKGELALLLGTTPETFSRLLKKLVEEGVIAVEGKEITLLQKLPHE